MADNAGPKRLHYFNTQFLEEQDFNDEQNYHVDMRRRHNQALHTWGVADGGLLVTRADDQKVSIGAGMAIDQAGHEIVVLAPIAYPLETSVLNPNVDVYVTIQYHEEKDGFSNPRAENNYTRWAENPQPAATLTQPPNDGSVILLAKIHLDANSNIATIDLSVRTLASSKLSNLSVTNATASLGFAIERGIAVLRVSNSAKDSMSVLDLENDANAWQLRVDGNDGDKLKIYDASRQTTDLTIDKSGNVGIGIVTPSVNGLHIGSGVAGGQAQLRLDNANGEWGMINRWTNRLQILASDGVGISVGDGNSENVLWIGKDKKIWWGNSSLKTDQGGSIELGGDEIHAGTGTPYIDFHYQGKTEDYNTRIINDADGQLSLQAKTLYVSGKVGIGTTTPGQSLTLENKTGRNYLNVKDATHEVLLGVDENGGIISVMTDHDLIFRTGKNLERMRITAGGNVGIATTLGFGKQPRQMINLYELTYGIGVQGGVQYYRTDGHFAWYKGGVHNDAGLNPGGGVLQMALSDKGDLTIAGNAFKPGGGAWSAPSDIKLKNNVVPLEGALTRLLLLRGVSFEWKEPEKQGNLTGIQMGMVAQEVEQVFPEWVGTSPDGNKFISIRGFEALSVESFRELKAEIDALKQKVETVEARLGSAGEPPSAEDSGHVMSVLGAENTVAEEEKQGTRRKNKK